MDNLLIPQYVKNFSCIGPRCEDSCCEGWAITIDRKSYKRYKTCNNLALKNTLIKSISRNRKSATELSYGKFKLDKDNKCLLLDENGLCNIHKHLGEENLCLTCRTYPRMTNIIDEVYEKSATISCPEVARLALLNPNPMEFDQVEISADESTKSTIKAVITTKDENVGKYFWNLRIFTIEGLQYRDIELWKRLVLLGMFYEKVDEVISNKKYGEIPNLLIKYRDYFRDETIHKSLEQLPSQGKVKLRILTEVVSLRLNSGITSERFLECCRELEFGLGLEEKVDIEDALDNYIKAYNNNFKPFMEKKEHILENYLINSVFMNLFPIGPTKSLYENYVRLIINYCTIVVFLVGSSAYHKDGFSEEHVIKVIQSFGRTFEHNNSFLSNLFNNFKESDLISLAHMIILLKN